MALLSLRFLTADTAITSEFLGQDARFFRGQQVHDLSGVFLFHFRKDFDG